MTVTFQQSLLGKRTAALGASAAIACSLLAPPDSEYVGGVPREIAGWSGSTTPGGAATEGGSAGTPARAGAQSGGNAGGVAETIGGGAGEESAGAAGRAACPPEFPTRCGEDCTDLGTDAAHCGDCDRACPGDLVCHAGDCGCRVGQHVCGETCVERGSVESCGTRCAPCPVPDHGVATCDGAACGVRCNIGFSSCEDGCTDLRTDARNCGGCGAEFACTGDASCQAGRCVSVSGCSDGTREGFDAPGAYLAIAGCNADWPMGSMRAAKTGVPCGVGLGVCATPADACGEGWHVCGTPPYGPEDVSLRATLAECLAQNGAFAAALGDQVCEPCSTEGPGAACCGNRCVQQNGSCIYPGMTPWFGVILEHVNLCGAIESTSGTRGVLCCLDL